MRHHQQHFSLSVLFSILSTIIIVSIVVVTLLACFSSTAFAADSSSPSIVSYERKRTLLDDSYNNNNNNNNNNNGVDGSLPLGLMISSCNKTFGDQSPCPDSVSMVWAEGSLTHNFSAGAIQHGGLELKLSLCCGYQFHSALNIPDIHTLRKLKKSQIDRINDFFQALVDRGPAEVKKAARDSMFPVVRLYSEMKALVDKATAEKKRATSTGFGGFFSSSSSSSSSSFDEASAKQQSEEDSGIDTEIEIDWTALSIPLSSFPVVRLSDDRRVLFLKSSPVPSFEISRTTFDAQHPHHIVKYVVHHHVLDCQCPRSFRVPQTALFVDDALPDLSLSGGGNLCQKLTGSSSLSSSEDNNQKQSSKTTTEDPHQFRISIDNCDALLPVWMSTEWTIIKHHNNNALKEVVSLQSTEEQQHQHQPQSTLAPASASTSACAVLGVSGFDFDVPYLVRVNISVGSKHHRVIQTVFTRRRNPVPLNFAGSASINNILYGRSSIIALKTPFFHPESFIITCRAPTYLSNTNPFHYAKQFNDKNEKLYEELSLCFVNDTAVRIAGLKPSITRILCEVSDASGACGRGVVSELPNVRNIQAKVETQEGDLLLQQVYDNPTCRADPVVFWHKTGQLPAPDGSHVERRMCGQNTIIVGAPYLPPSSSNDNNDDDDSASSLSKKYITRFSCVFVTYQVKVNEEGTDVSSVTTSSQVGLLLPEQSSRATCSLKLYLKKSHIDFNDPDEVLDTVLVEVSRVQQKYAVTASSSSGMKNIFSITTKTKSLEVPSPYDNGNAPGYWFIDSPLSILPSDKKEIIQITNNNNNNNNNNSPLQSQTTARIGNLPYPRQGALNLAFVEESIWPCKELAWNATIEVSVAPPEKPIPPRCFWTDKSVHGVSDPLEPAAPDEQETFILYSRSSTQQKSQNVTDADFHFVPLGCFPCSVDGEATLEQNLEHSAEVSNLNEGRCVEIVRTVGNSAGSFSAPFVVRRCTSVPTAVCSTAQVTLQGRAFSSITDTVRVSAPELPIGLEGEWSCDRGDVVIEDSINKPHEVTVKNLPRGQTICHWSIQGKGEGGRDKHLCPSCTVSVRLVAAASDCPDTLQQVCSGTHELPLYDTNLVNRDMAMNLQYELQCNNDNNINNNNNIRIKAVPDLVKGVMRVSEIPVGDLNCTLFASGVSSSTSTTGSSNSNRKECPIVFSRRLPASDLNLFRTDMVDFIASVNSEGNNNNNAALVIPSRSPSLYVGIVGHPYHLSVNVTLPKGGSSFSAYSAYWTFRPKGSNAIETATSMNTASASSSTNYNNNNEENNNNNNNNRQTLANAKKMYTSFSETGIVSVDGTLLTFSTTFFPKTRGLYTVSVSIRDPTNVCPDVNSEVQGTIVDAEVIKETIYSCGASSSIKALAIPEILSPVIESRWVLAARSSNNINCTRAQIHQQISTVFTSGSDNRNSNNIVIKFNNGVATVQGLGFGICTFDWIVAMKHNASMARWKSVNVDTLSENVPANGTAYLVAAESLSLWASTASSEWHIVSPPNVNQFRAMVRKSPSGRSIVIDGLELPPIHIQQQLKEALPPYVISYRPYPLKQPPHGAVPSGQIECPRHFFTVTRVNVTVQGRLVELSSECDLVRGGLVVLELSGASHVKFRTDFRLIEKEIRRMNSKNQNDNNNNKDVNSNSYRQQQQQQQQSNQNQKFWADADSADWSDFLLSQDRRILRFRLRMRKFVDSRELLNIDFFEHTRIPLTILQGLSGTGPSSVLTMKKSGQFVAPILPRHVQVGRHLDYDPDLLVDTEQQQQQQQQQHASSTSSSSFDLNPPDIFISQKLSSFARFNKDLISVSEYDFAAGNVHFNVSFAENILRPVPRIHHQYQNNNNNNGKLSSSSSSIVGITNFSSCPVYNRGKQITTLIAPLIDQPLTGRCVLFDSDENENVNDENGKNSNYNNNVNDHFLLNTQLGPGRYFTIDQQQVSVLRISKRSLCGLCDSRLNPYHRDAIENMIALHEEDQRNWSKFVADIESREDRLAVPGSSSSSSLGKPQQQQQEEGDNITATPQADESNLAPQHEQQQAPTSTEPTEEIITSTINSDQQQPQHQKAQQQQRCATTPVDFSTNDWVTVGALNILPESSNLVSTRRDVKQCAIAYGIKKFVVQARHGFFLHPSSSSAIAQASATSVVTDIEIPLNISLFVPSTGAQQQQQQQGEYVDLDAFNILQKHLKPIGIIRAKYPRQLIVSVQPVPQLQIQKSTRIVLKIEVPTEYYFNGDVNSTLPNAAPSFFTLTIHRSHAAMEILTTDRQRILEHVCENTIKHFGVVARISLEGDTWHKSVGDEKVNGANIAMINGFYDTPHAISFQGGDAQDVLEQQTQQQQQQPSSSLTSPFVSYLSTVLKPHHVKRISDTVVEIEIPPCVFIPDEPLPACALISAESFASSSSSSSSSNINNNINNNQHHNEFYQEPLEDFEDNDDNFGMFLATELISFAVPGSATSCPGCLVAQPPMNVLGLAASVLPSLDPTPLTSFPSAALSNSRLFSGIIPKSSSSAQLPILPREIYLHSLCSRWVAPSSPSHHSSTSSFWSNTNNLKARRRLQQQQGRRDNRNNNNYNNNHQQQIILKDDINSNIVGVYIRSPTVLAVRLGAKVSHNHFQNQQQQERKFNLGSPEAYQEMIINGRNNENDFSNDDSGINFANALIPVPVDWLYNSSVKMSIAEPWFVTLERASSSSYDSSSSGGRFRSSPERQAWYHKLRYIIAYLIYSIFNSYLWFSCFTTFFSAPAATSLQRTGLQPFMTNPFAVSIFAISLYIEVASFTGAVLTFVPWIVLLIFRLRRFSPVAVNNGGTMMMTAIANANSSPASRRALQQQQQQGGATFINGLPGRQPHAVQLDAVPTVFISWALVHFVLYFWLSMW